MRLEPEPERTKATEIQFGGVGGRRETRDAKKQPTHDCWKSRERTQVVWFLSPFRREREGKV